MSLSAVRPTADEIETAVERYADALFRLCFTMLGSAADAEDAVSDSFVKYIERAPRFRDEEHRKAWLLRVATNQCRDKLRADARHRCVDLDEIAAFCPERQDSEILEALLALPPKLKEAVYLHYVAGYSTAETASILRITPAAVRKRLQYGREHLKLECGREQMV